MNFKNLIEDVLEESIKVAGLKTGFNQIIPNVNYVDSHQQLPEFGSCWGRGVITNSNGKLDVIIGSFGASHSELKKQMRPDESTNGTFYYGFCPKTKILYFEYGSDRTFTFDNKVLTAIINALKSSPGYFRNMSID